MVLSSLLPKLFHSYLTKYGSIKETTQEQKFSKKSWNPGGISFGVFVLLGVPDQDALSEALLLLNIELKISNATSRGKMFLSFLRYPIILHHAATPLDLQSGFGRASIPGFISPGIGEASMISWALSVASKMVWL